MRPSSASVVLSEAGAARREAILAAAQRALRGRRRRRMAGRAVLVAAPVLALAMVVAARAGAMRASGGSARVVSRSAEPAEPARPDARRAIPVMRFAAFEEVPTESGLADRLEGRGGRASVEFLNDDSLLDELRAIGRPTGMIRIAGRVEFTRHLFGDGADGGG